MFQKPQRFRDSLLSLRATGTWTKAWTQETAWGPVALAGSSLARPLLGGSSPQPSLSKTLGGENLLLEEHTAPKREVEGISGRMRSWSTGD